MDATTAKLDLRQGPLPAYRVRVASGVLAADPSQLLAAERLQDLWVKLRGYDPPPRPVQNGFLSRLLRLKPVDDVAEARPNGLYLAGEVGRGKSMLMDLFFAAAQVGRKRRLHFDQFMQEVHARIHEWRAREPNGDPIPPLADRIAAEAALLCFDEFQVNDIADAMILGRLFEALFERHVVVVATSNTAPGDLFKGQPGRDAFLPFITLLQEKLELLVLEAGRDFRRERLSGMPTWYVPADAGNAKVLDQVFARLTGGKPGRPDRLSVMGRWFEIPRAAAGVARFSFAELCGGPRGPGDYLALATHYHTLVLDAVPRFGPDRSDEARRFITLVDALYDHRVKLVAAADALPDQLYDLDDSRGAAMFARTSSRLAEMQSKEWLALPHLT